MLSKEATSTIFCVFGMTRPGIESRSREWISSTKFKIGQVHRLLFIKYFLLPRDNVCLRVCVCVCVCMRVCASERDREKEKSNIGRKSESEREKEWEKLKKETAKKKSERENEIICILFVIKRLGLAICYIQYIFYL